MDWKDGINSLMIGEHLIIVREKVVSKSQRKIISRYELLKMGGPKRSRIIKALEDSRECERLSDNNIMTSNDRGLKVKCWKLWRYWSID